jgi:CxxC motif-containing protein (DUF1111 family)
MPFFRLVRATFRLPDRQFALAPPGGRLFGVGLVALGLGLLAVAAAPMLAGAQSAPGPRDPGVRGGSPGAGGHISGLTTNQIAFFNEGLNRFNEVDAVVNGLGPRFNMDSCAGCHAQPAPGGTSPFVNPQVSVASKAGATNSVPSFITLDGPVREVRFIHNPDGSADGGVHDLFTIAGRSDAPGCSSSQIQQPNFAAEAGNIIFRIPTPLFGAGLIASISDRTIIENHESTGFLRSLIGITGHENREGNAGTITRFGWKAQNKSLMIFSGEAYLVEQGVSNELFTQERGEPLIDGESQRVEPNPACLFNGTPEDITNFDSTATTGTMNDVEGFALFGTMLAPPQPAAMSPGATLGRNFFDGVGCALCHTPSLTTGKSSIGALTGQAANLFSDLMVHHMGSGLADNISQGGAGPDEFRTAPLWGVGQRIFFLHDGRTRDLFQAIEQHASTGSEANQVINNFNAIGPAAQQDILNFLRSL